MVQRAESVREWVTALNPYEQKGSVFPLEEANYLIEEGMLNYHIEPLYVLTVSRLQSSQSEEVEREADSTM